MTGTGRPLPQYVPPARRQSFRQPPDGLIDTSIIKTLGRTVAPCAPVPESFRSVLHIFDIHGHQCSPTFYGVVRIAIPSYLHGYCRAPHGITALRETVWERVGEDFREQRAQVWPLYAGEFAAPRAYLRHRRNHNSIKFSDWQFRTHTTTNRR